MNKVMILKANSSAIHKLGDIRREVDDYIHVTSETETHYIGSFITGYGFVDVQYAKEDVRNLTEEEVKDLNNSYIQLGGAVTRYNVDSEGNITPFVDKYKFQVGEIVMIKRTSGEWTEGEIVFVTPYTVTIKVDVNGQDGYKLITDNDYDTHIQRMSIIQKGEN